MAGILYEIIFGPVIFGMPFLEKRVRKATLVVSKEAEAIMYVATSASDVGEFTGDMPVGVGKELDMEEISIPVAQGDASGGFVYRIRVRGTGSVQVHDVIFDVSPRVSGKI